MRIVFNKTSHETHGLFCIRDNGSEVRSDALESKSYLRHDLMHYCVEKHAGLSQSFYGLIASGKTFEEMRSMEEGGMPNPEALMTERIVARLQNSHHEEAFHADQTYARISDSFSLQDALPPSYFNENFVSSSVSEFRYLLKKWNNLKTGESLELLFP